MVDETALFLHVLAAMGIVAGGSVQILAGVRLRAASAPADIATWASFTRSAGWLILGSAFVSLLTGGHLAAAVWTTETTSGFSRPFITLGMAGLLLLAPFGPMIGGARLRRLVAAATTEEASRADLVADARSRKLWGPMYSLLGVSIGLVALMVYKPGWVAGAVLLVATWAAGWAAGFGVSERSRAPSSNAG